MSGNNLLGTRLITLFGTLIIIIGAIFLMWEGGSSENPSSSNPSSPSGSIIAELASQKIQYTKHARCRMECRNIDESEIKEMLQEGKINQRKSKPNDTPCPSYAVEGVTHDNQTVRIVYADCGNTTKVITAIDLDTDWKCHCK